MTSDSPNQINANAIEEIANGLFAIARGLQAIANNTSTDNLAHNICMGIRKGIFGADADNNSTILDLMRPDEE